MYILFDIGGTKMRIAAARDFESFGEPKIIPTPKTFEDGMAAFVAATEELSGGEKIKALAGGFSGSFNRTTGDIYRAPNLDLWNGKPLLSALKERFGVPVFIDNDVAIVGMGEAHNGAAKGYPIAVYVSISTGVNGVRIVDGKIDRSRWGFEIGHQVIDLDGTTCELCNIPGRHTDGPGHLEGYVSGTAFQERFHKAPKEIDDSTVWDRTAHYLAYGLNNTILHWSPDVVVLGGSMIVGDPAIDIELVKKYLNDILLIFPEYPEIKKAQLGDVGGLHGALELLKQQATFGG